MADVTRIDYGTASAVKQAGNIPCYAHGVVSTDAIGQLGPFVPKQSPRQPHKRLTPQQVRAAVRRWPRRSGFAQITLTAAPLWVGDMIALTGCFAGVQMLTETWLSLSLPELVKVTLAISMAYSIIAYLLGLFPATAISPVYELRQLVVSSALSFALVLAFSMGLGRTMPSELFVGIAGAMIATAALPMVRAAVRHHFQRYSWWGERVIVIGSGMQGRAIYSFYLRAPQRGLRPVGVVDQAKKPFERTSSLRELELAKGASSTPPYLGPVSRLSRIARRYSARWGIVAPGGCDGMDMLQVISYAGALPHVVILPSQFSLPSLWSCPCECAGVIGIHIRDQLQDASARFIKRTSDITGALTGLLLFLPLFLLAAAWIKLRSPGPVLYGQKRIGRHGIPFTAWKFRTMVVDADDVLEDCLENDPDMRQQWMVYQKLKNDPRVIPGVGIFLRKSSLDELPQLWNILKGDMSMVGPRPCMRSQIGLYQQMYPLYTRVRPGLTGLWQVSGRNETSYEQRVRLDSYYVCNWSLWLDLYILMRTLRTLILREGAY